MSDIVERLRYFPPGSCEYEAASEIERLKAALWEMERHARMTNNQDSWMSRALKLEAALREIAGLSHNCRGTDIARAALEGRP